MSDGSEPTAAESAFLQAASALDREQLLERLATRKGLAYGRLGGDPCGPYLVARDGQLIGEVRSATTSALKDWFAHGLEQSAGPTGPFNTIREAAASLRR